MGRAVVLTVVAMLAGCLAAHGSGAVPDSAVRSESIDAPERRPAPMTVDELREHEFDVSLSVVGPLDDGPSFTAYLVAYQQADLTLHAMVAVPRAPAPEGGYPLVIANHGYVPDPRRYGITADGIDSRPGDYYRSVPELFTSRGFLTVMPDYRGHNSSDGFDYIDPQDDDSIAYYAEDVVALMSALDDLDGANLDQVFMWSHSMGGPVSLRAMLATDIVKAASFWSTMPVDALQPCLAEFEVPVSIQHEIGDESTSVGNSERLNRMLRGRGVPTLMNLWTGSDHFFTGDAREAAADRDAEFFRQFMD